MTSDERVERLYLVTDSHWPDEGQQIICESDEGIAETIWSMILGDKPANPDDERWQEHAALMEQFRDRDEWGRNSFTWSFEDGAVEVKLLDRAALAAAGPVPKEDAEKMVTRLVNATRVFTLEAPPFMNSVINEFHEAQKALIVALSTTEGGEKQP